MNNMWRIHPCKEKYVEIPPYNDKCEKSLPAMKNMWRMVLELFAKGSNVRDLLMLYLLVFLVLVCQDDYDDDHDDNDDHHYNDHDEY